MITIALLLLFLVLHAADDMVGSAAGGCHMSKVSTACSRNTIPVAMVHRLRYSVTIDSLLDRQSCDPLSSAVVASSMETMHRIETAM